MPRLWLAVGLVAMVALTTSVASAYTVTVIMPFDPIESGGEWQYYYQLQVELGSGESISSGWWWQMTDLAGVTNAGTPAGGDWSAQWSDTWVRWTYNGDTVSGPDTYSWGNFDISATGGPDPNRPWSEVGGASGTITGPLPEPSTIGLILLGLGTLGAGIRRRRRT